MGANPEITRFKGLGEISGEFSHFIGKDIKLDPVIIPQGMATKELLLFYMGKILLNDKALLLIIFTLKKT